MQNLRIEDKMKLNNYINLNKPKLLDSTFSKLLLFIIFGIICGLILSIILSKEFYFYQAVLAALFCIPIISLFLLYSTRRSLLGLLVLTIPFNPSFHLLRNNSIEIGTGILFYTSDLILIAIFVYVFLSNLLGNQKEQKSYASFWHLGFPLLFWIVAGIVSILPAVNKSIVIFELIRMLRMAIFFIAVFFLVEGYEDIRFVAACLVAALAIQTILVFGEYVLCDPLFRLPGEGREADTIGELIRPGGTMGHSSNFAKLASLGLPICFAYIFVVRKNIWRIVLGGTLIAVLMALILTVSRAGIAASFFGLTWVFIILGKNVRNKKRIILISWIILSVGIGSSWYLGGNRLINRITDDRGSARSRLPQFSVAWNVIKVHPFIGVGLNNYTLVAPDYDLTPTTISVVFPHPVHNIYMLYAAEMGIPGALFFIWFLFATLTLAFNRNSQDMLPADLIISKAIGVGIICSWSQGLIDWGFRSSIVHISYLAVLAGALVSVKYTNQKYGQENINER